MILCYVTDRKSLPDPAAPQEAAPGDKHAGPQTQFAPLLARISAAVAAGLDWIQLREKDLTARDSAALSRVALHQSLASPAKIIVNDRLDVALAVHAHGVHLGERSLSASDVRRFVKGSSPQPFLTGVSCHSLAGAVSAAAAADYLFFGPIFDTPAKRVHGSAQGVARLAEVCRAVRVPVIAIGGITLENVSSCVHSGAAGIAAIRLFQQSADLPALAAALRHSR